MLFLNDDTGSDQGMPDRAEISAFVQWNLWKRRMPPYKRLADGDDIVLVKSWPGGGRLTWQVRAFDVTKMDYTRKADAVDAIWAKVAPLGWNRQDVVANRYTVGKADQGHLLFLRTRPVRRLALPKPPDMKIWRQG